MMRYFLAILFLGIALNATAQKGDTPTDTTERVFTIVEQMPQFPGGEGEMLKFIRENVKPVCTKGRVYVSFVVDSIGFVRSPKVLRRVSPECDAEAMRVIQSMPQWIPGKQNKRAVAVQYNLPVNFGKD